MQGKNKPKRNKKLRLEAGKRGSRCGISTFLCRPHPGGGRGDGLESPLRAELGSDAEAEGILHSTSDALLPRSSPAQTPHADETTGSLHFTSSLHFMKRDRSASLAARSDFISWSPSAAAGCGLGGKCGAAGSGRAADREGCGGGEAVV